MYTEKVRKIREKIVQGRDLMVTKGEKTNE